MTTKPDAVYLITCKGDTLFPEVWRCEVTYKWNHSPTHNISHIEFRHDGPGAISPTGYHSDFSLEVLDDENVEEYISAFLAYEKVTGYSITKETAHGN